MNEADVTKTHAAKIDALNRLAASLIRSGAPVDAVQKFVDAEIDRIEFMPCVRLPPNDPLCLPLSPDLGDRVSMSPNNA